MIELNIRGRLVRYERPAVMGIINITPDSFFAGSRVRGEADIRARAEGMVARGADMLDLGACSTRPGAEMATEVEETERLVSAVEAVRAAVGAEVPVSVDTFRASVAQAAVEAGADIVNDISGGLLDGDMFATVAELRVPYVLMHSRGTPATMQSLTDYPGGVVADVIGEMSGRLAELHALGVADVIVDPGFGFAKTLEQNYELMANLERFALLGCPVLVGISRKSMATKALGISADEALNATTVLNTMALERGAAILRVHDPLEARQAVLLTELLRD